MAPNSSALTYELLPNFKQALMVIDSINDDDHALFVIKRVSPEIVSVWQQSNSNGFSKLLSILCVCLEHYSDDAYDGIREVCTRIACEAFIISG